MDMSASSFTIKGRLQGFNRSTFPLIKSIQRKGENINIAIGLTVVAKNAVTVRESLKCHADVCLKEE